MAAATRSAKYNSLGVSAGPDSTVLVDAVNLDVDSNIEFGIVGPAEAIEVVVISGTAKTGTPSVVINVQAFDDASGTWVTLLASAALADAGTKVLLVGPNVPQVANVSAAHVLRQRMRVNLDYTGTPVTDVLNNVTVAVYAF
jgi:hypothetical protein